METKSSELVIAGNQKTVSIKRTINLPLSQVWKAWTDPETFMMWWGPKDFTCPFCTIDLKVGGKNLSCMKGPDGKEYWSTGTYQEISPMKKLVYIDSFSDANGKSVSPSYYDMPGKWGDKLMVTVTLDEIEGKTRMHLEHEGIPEEMYDDCVMGWQQSFDKMENKLSKNS